MNLLSNLYRNKAQTLQEKLSILQKELKLLEEGFVDTTTSGVTSLADPLTLGTVGGLVLTDIATKKYQPKYPEPKTFTGRLAQEFGTAPVTQGVIEMGKQGTINTAKAIASPVQTTKNIAQGTKDVVSRGAQGIAQAVKHPAESAKAIAGGIGKVSQLGLGLGLPLVAGHVTHEIVDTGLESLGMESGMDRGEAPTPRDVASSAADWAAMTASGQALANIFAGRALGTGLAAAAGVGAIGGAFAPVAIYGGLKAAEGIRGIKTGENETVGDWIDQQFGDVAYYITGGEELYPQTPSVIYDKAEKMKKRDALQSKTEKEVEQSAEKPFVLPQY